MIINTTTNSKQQNILEAVTPYIEHINTIRAWDAYRRLNPDLKLPSSEAIKRNFNSWNNFKKSIGLDVNLPSHVDYTKDEYIQLLTPHKEHLKTMADWEKYRDRCIEIELPSSSTIKTIFNSWKNVKKALKIDNLEKEKPKFNELMIKKNMTSALTEDEYINLIKHIEHLTTTSHWEKYRKQNPDLHLLSSSILQNRFTSWNCMKQFFGLETTKIRLSISSLTEEECINLLMPYKEHFSSTDDWVAFLEENPNLRLPSKNTLIRYFGTWNNMKEKLGLVVYVRTDKVLLGKDEYLDLLEPYKEHLISSNKWDKFREQHQDLKLPSSHTLILLSEGSWVNVKKDYGLI